MISLNRSGLEGLPLKLLLIFSLLVISTPIVMNSAIYFDNLVTENDLLRQAFEIRNSAQSAYLSGLGNVRTVVIEIRSTTFGEPCALEVGGGRSDGEAYKIKCFIGGNHCGTLYIDNPAIPIITDSGYPLKIENGKTMIRLECIEFEGEIFVKIAVVTDD